MQAWGICYNKKRNVVGVMQGWTGTAGTISPGSLPGIGKRPAVGCQDLLSQCGGFVRVWTIRGQPPALLNRIRHTPQELFARLATVHVGF